MLQYTKVNETNSTLPNVIVFFIFHVFLQKIGLGAVYIDNTTVHRRKSAIFKITAWLGADYVTEKNVIAGGVEPHVSSNIDRILVSLVWTITGSLQLI